MKKTLILLSHPNYDNSVANKVIIDILNKQENIRIRHIDKLYHDYKIDVEKEQKELIESDNIIFQFPFYWYSVPASLKNWLDKVFSFGFAYGPKGDKLKGKNFIVSTTIGGPSDAYQPMGNNNFRIEQLLLPLEQTSYLTGMNFQASIYSHRMVYIPGVYNAKAEIEQRAIEHANKIITTINTLNKRNAQEIIEEFVVKWFQHFDDNDEAGFFIQYLSPSVKMKFIDGEYNGHEGFVKWHANISSIIAEGKHDITSIKVTHNNNMEYSVEAAVDFNANLNAKNNKNVQTKVNFTLILLPSNHLVILSYNWSFDL